jgi:hypothetical protein
MLFHRRPTDGKRFDNSYPLTGEVALAFMVAKSMEQMVPASNVHVFTALVLGLVTNGECMCLIDLLSINGNQWCVPTVSGCCVPSIYRHFGDGL